jgi:Predicted thiamine-pyrophosphate-binding protein
VRRGVAGGGVQPLAAMQNSGLGYCLEVLTSLHLMYRLPLPMLVSDRGAAERL